MKKILFVGLMLSFFLTFLGVNYVPLSFNNSEISITIKPEQIQGIQMYEIRVENLTGYDMEIYWDKSYITDNLGNSSDIILNETLQSGNYEQQYPTLVFSKGVMEKYILPRTHASGDVLYNSNLEDKSIRIFLKYDIDGIEREVFGNLKFSAAKEKGPMDDAWPWIIGGVGVAAVIGIILLQKGP